MHDQIYREAVAAVHADTTDEDIQKDQFVVHADISDTYVWRIMDRDAQGNCTIALPDGVTKTVPHTNLVRADHVKMAYILKMGNAGHIAEI